MSKCIKCGAENPASAKFCIKCGRDLSLVFCPVCGQPVHNWERKCKMCNSEWDDKWNVTKNRPPKHPELEKAGNDFDFYITVILIIIFIVCAAWGIVQWFIGQF